MNTSDHSSSRRRFIKQSALFGTLTLLPSGIVHSAKSKSKASQSANEKVNLAVVGIGNQGFQDLRLMANSGFCQVVALCEVDLQGKHTQQAQQLYGASSDGPHKARTFTDFRKMFDSMGDQIDAVLVATPDHSHFAVTMLAMSLGKHVFVEKPLAHTYGQCQRLMDMAAKNPKLVTQMGNQGHSGANYFQFKAWSEAGLIKDITKITAHMNRKRRWHGWGATATAYPKTPLPDGLDWDQWIDSASHLAPHSNKLHPQEWRSWYNYGSGCFGDWGPHILDTSHRFLQLGLPETITAVQRDGVNATDLIYPQSSTIRFAFPERGPGLPACTVNWFDGVNNMPELEGKWTPDGKAKPLNAPGKVLYGKDIAFQGGSHASPLRVLPREKFIEMRSSLPKFALKNSNHYANFLLACLGKEEARSPFSVAGPLSQMFSLGILAQRFGGEIKFDRAQGKITNHQIAQALLDPAPRPGWESYYKL